MNITKEHRIAQSWCHANGYKIYPIPSMGRYKIIIEKNGKTKQESNEWYFDKTTKNRTSWSDKIWELMLTIYTKNNKKTA